MSERTIARRVCPLCEATCGLELTVEAGRIARVRGDGEHVFSHGFICPKGVAFGELVHDPDRLRRPLIRTGSDWAEVSWDRAFEVVDSGLQGAIEAGGRHAVALYVGNPSVHTMAGGQMLGVLVRSLATRNYYTAASVDQIPKHVSCGHMFGDPLAFPVPDLDRTDFVLMLGANPWESNGSLATAPDFKGRLKAIQARGGAFVVVDPRRTATAAHADEHLQVRPGSDPLLLFALVNVLFAEGLVRLGRLAEHVTGLSELESLAAPFTPERVAPACAISAERMRGLARRLAAAPTACVYGRVGTSTVEFGTLASWLIDVLNVLTGNLDSPGGAMFPLAPHQRQRLRPGGKGFAIGAWSSRVRGVPEAFKQLPVAVLAEEIDTPGPDQVRALISYAGNPVLSTPNSGRLDLAMGGLDFMVSIDPYLNETTRHAHVILPPPDPARVAHYDFSFLALSIRNLAVYSPPVLPPDPAGMADSEILARLAMIASGQGAHPDMAAAEEVLLGMALARAVEDESSRAHGRDASELRAMVTGSGLPERLLDVAVRAGAYGDGFGSHPGGLNLDVLLAHPHGIDLGPLEPRLPELLRTPSARIELCPQPIAADVPRLLAALARPPAGLVLVGRRHLRSNNSWMHNLPSLVRGKDRCTLQVHPEDAARLDLVDGGVARVSSRAGAVVAPVEVTADVMRGVVSLPHGWGHAATGTRLRVAEAHAGVNSNLLADETVIDPLSGNAVLNGIPVCVEAAEAASV